MDVSATGRAEDIYANPQHVYTKRLLSAIPVIDPENRSNKPRRKEAEKFYQENQKLYYDETVVY